MKTVRSTQTKPASHANAASADASPPQRTIAAPVPSRPAAQDILAEFRQQTILRALRACSVFAEMAGPDLLQVAALSRTRWLAKGDWLFRQGERVTGLFVVQMGAVQVSRRGPHDHEQLLHIFRAGEVFAEEDLTSETGYTADARAGEESQVVEIEKAGFLALLRVRPELSLRLLRAMNEQLCRLVHLLDDLRLKDVRARVAGWLIAHCPDPESRAPVNIELPTTKRVLAAKLGAASETFSRTVARLRAQKLVAVNGRTITLLCPARLARLYSVTCAARGPSDQERRWQARSPGLAGGEKELRTVLVA